MSKKEQEMALRLMHKGQTPNVSNRKDLIKTEAKQQRVVNKQVQEKLKIKTMVR